VAVNQRLWKPGATWCWLQ